MHELIDEVSGLFIDIANLVMASSGLDGRLMFWDFSSHRLMAAVQHSAGLTVLQGFRDNGLVAVAALDRVVRVYDMQTYKLTRYSHCMAL